jgi:hypothetical protein
MQLSQWRKSTNPTSCPESAINPAEEAEAFGHLAACFRPTVAA